MILKQRNVNVNTIPQPSKGVFSSVSGSLMAKEDVQDFEEIIKNTKK